MNLNNTKNIKALDPGRVGDTIELLPDQMRQVLEEARLIKVPREYSKVANVVINGMGGSNLGAHILRSIWSDKIKVPVNITPGYEIPAYVGKNTLYLISSYSGTTEEPLSVYREVKKRGAKIMGITARGRGRFEKLMIKDNLPGYIFSPRHNPSGQPRLGVGYSIFGMASLLAKAGLFSLKISGMQDLIAWLELATRKLKPEETTRLNPAKRLVEKIYGKIPILVGAEHLSGNLPVMRNHIAECSKAFAAFLVLPDLNHFAMEGLLNPPLNKTDLIFVFFDSKLYHPRITKRSELTKQVVKKNKIAVITHSLKAETKVAQGFELLQLGMWVSYYLGIIYGADPQKIPWVDWFKKQLN